MTWIKLDDNAVDHHKVTRIRPFTPEQLWRTDLVQRHLSLAMQHKAKLAAEALADQMSSNIRITDSPLEAAFLAWWSAVAIDWEIGICGQREVEACGRAYRLDFVFSADQCGYFTGLVGHDLHPKIALELDGHAFHEKTREQVTYRNRRDRDLQSAGWRVLHVSFDEFNRDPLACVESIQNSVRDAFYMAARLLREMA